MLEKGEEAEDIIFSFHRQTIKHLSNQGVTKQHEVT
jgi:hypothetical protein